MGMGVCKTQVCSDRGAIGNRLETSREHKERLDPTILIFLELVLKRHPGQIR